LIKVYHQVSLGASDTLESKRLFEAEASQCGVSVDSFHADNGIFKAQAWTAQLQEQSQGQSLSGVGAHHQNALAERAIQTVHNSARAMLLHVQIHWPDEYDTRLWPFALDYAAWLYNHTPKDNGIAPIEVFCGTRTSCTYLRRARVFGAPTYVLDPRMQDGKKLPKWEPRSRRGQFLGFSRNHSSSVGLIRNLQTQHVSVQFHCIYDESFSTVPGGIMGRSIEELTLDQFHVFLSSQWDTSARDFVLADWVPEVDGPFPTLPPDQWNTPAIDGHLLPDPDLPPSTRVRFQLDPDPLPVRRQLSFDTIPPASLEQSDHPAYSDEGEHPASPHQDHLTLPDEDELPSPFSPLIAPAAPPISHQQGELSPVLAETAPPALATIHPSSISSSPSPLPPRRSARLRAQASFTRLLPALSTSTIRAFFSRPLSPPTLSAMLLDWDSHSSDPIAAQFEELMHIATLSDDSSRIHPLAFQVRLNRTSDADMPTFAEILRLPAGPELDGWFESMDVELRALFAMRVYDIVSRSTAVGREIVPTTWAFMKKKKRKPDGSFLKFKSRLVIRGDRQQEGLHDGESTLDTDGYAPVIEWGTLRMLFTLSVQHVCAMAD
jgi:hypothetical protein